MGTVVVGAVLVGVVALIVRSMVKDKKNGKSLQCGGDCATLRRTLQPLKVLFGGVDINCRKSQRVS